MERILLHSEVFGTDGAPRSDVFGNIGSGGGGDVFIGKNEIVGDGTTTSFTVPHLLTGITTASNIITTPNSAAAMEPSWYDVDATNIIINFKTAPAADASVVFNWQIIK